MAASVQVARSSSCSVPTHLSIPLTRSNYVNLLSSDGTRLIYPARIAGGPTASQKRREAGHETPNRDTRREPGGRGLRRSSRSIAAAIAVMPWLRRSSARLP